MALPGLLEGDILATCCQIRKRELGAFVNILVVDDEDRISEFIASAEGFTTVTQVLRQHYDLITVDLKMPDASGLDIIGSLRDMCPHAVIVIISGFLPKTVPSDVASAVDVMLAKPVRVDALKKLFHAADQIGKIMDEIHVMAAEEGRGT